MKTFPIIATIVKTRIAGFRPNLEEKALSALNEINTEEMVRQLCRKDMPFKLTPYSLQDGEDGKDRCYAPLNIRYMA